MYKFIVTRIYAHMRNSFTSGGGKENQIPAFELTFLKGNAGPVLFF
jgi:hypothetical protein